MNNANPAVCSAKHEFRVPLRAIMHAMQRILIPMLTLFFVVFTLLYAGAAVVAVWLLLNERGLRRWIGAAVLLGLIVKVVSEVPWEGPLRQTAGLDFPVAPAAHATGLLAGALCGALAALGSGRASTSTPAARRP